MSTEDLRNPISRIADKIDEILVRIEIPLVIIIIAGIALSVAEIEIGDIIMNIAINVLAIMYFLTAFATYSQEGTAIPVSWKKILHKVTYWGFAIAVTGILFYLSEWPGYEVMSITASATLLILLFLTTMAIHKHDASDEYGQSFWMRYMIITGLSCYTVYKMLLPYILDILK